jgi:RHS repeat-associated protein
MASGAPGGIFNIVPIDSFLVSPGKTRKVQLNVASSEIMGAPADSSFYSMHAAVDNSSYFSGTRLFYFGARYYDPELGIWLSVDHYKQYVNKYSYCGYNPIMYIDTDGRFGVLTHLFSGGRKDAGVDWHSKRDEYYNKAIFPYWSKRNGKREYDPVRLWLIADPIFGYPSKQEKEWASDAHKVYSSKEKLIEFINDPCIPEEYKRHAIDDYYNQGEGSRPLTFDETVIQLFGKETREDYQDTDIGWILDPISSLSKSLFLKGEGNVMLGEWERNPFYLVNESHKQNLQEGIVEAPVSALDPTGISLIFVTTKSIVKRVERLWNWLFK